MTDNNSQTPAGASNAVGLQGRIQTPQTPVAMNAGLTEVTMKELGKYNLSKKGRSFPQYLLAALLAIQKLMVMLIWKI